MAKDRSKVKRQIQQEDFTADGDLTQNPQSRGTKEKQMDKGTEKRTEYMKSNRFKENVILVILGATLLVALPNLKTIMSAAGVLIGLVMPLIVGGIIAFILNVPMNFFERKLEWAASKNSSKRSSKLLMRMKTVISLVVTLVLFVLALIFIGNVIFPNMIDSGKKIADIIQQNYPSWIALAEGYGFDMSMANSLMEKLDWDGIIASIRDNSSEILSTAGQAATGVFGIIGNFLFGLIFAIYILLNKKKLARQAKQLAYAYLRKEWADEACDIASLSYKTFSNFLSGQCLEAVILGTMFFVTLVIGGFPYAATIGVVIGCMSLIPFVGAFIGLVFGVLLLAVVNIKQALWFVVIFFVIQQIEGHIVYPKVVGSSVGLPALWTLLAVVVGGKVSGVFGIIAFIPLFSVIYALVRRSVYSRLKQKNIKI